MNEDDEFINVELERTMWFSTSGMAEQAQNNNSFSLLTGEVKVTGPTAEAVLKLHQFLLVRSYCTAHASNLYRQAKIVALEC